jgi:hypothetical protein
MVKAFVRKKVGGDKYAGTSLNLVNSAPVTNLFLFLIFYKANNILQINYKKLLKIY